MVGIDFISFRSVSMQELNSQVDNTTPENTATHDTQNLFFITV